MRIAFSVALTLAVSVAPAMAQTVVAEYYPLKAGSKWTYTDVNSGQGFTLTAQDPATVNGSPALKLVRSDTGEYQQISNDAQGIRLHSLKDKTSVQTYKTPVGFLTAKAAVGAVLKTNSGFPNAATGNSTIWTAKYEGNEDVSVPAGKFPGCIKLSLVITDEKLGTKLANLNMWLAKGVGLVKRQGQFFGVFFVHQLTKQALVK